MSTHGTRSQSRLLYCFILGRPIFHLKICLKLRLWSVPVKKVLIGHGHWKSWRRKGLANLWITTWHEEAVEVTQEWLAIYYSICSMWHQQKYYSGYCSVDYETVKLAALICLARCSLGHARRTELWFFLVGHWDVKVREGWVDVWVAMWKLSNSLQGCGRMQCRSQCLWVPQLQTMTWCVKNVALPILPNMFLLSQIPSIHTDQLSSQEGQRMASGFAASIAAGDFEHRSDRCTGFDTQFYTELTQYAFSVQHDSVHRICCPCDLAFQLYRVQNIQEVNRDTIICNSAISACEKCIEWRLGGDLVVVPSGLVKAKRLWRSD